MDIWPDHINTFDISIEALFWPHQYLGRPSHHVIDVFEYENGPNSEFDPDVFIDITDTYPKLMKAMEAYRSFKGSNLPGIMRMMRVTREFRGFQ